MIELSVSVHFVKEPSTEESFRVRGPGDVAAYMAPKMKDLAVEELHALSLNSAGFVTGRMMISRGGLASSIVEPRVVYSYALSSMSAALVLVHNHPSGNPEPSAEDIAVTRQISEAGRIMGIPLRDHVIIAGDSWTSLAERGAV